MSEPFFSRWSQRKQALARGLPVKETASVQPTSTAVTTPQAATASVLPGPAVVKAPGAGTAGNAQKPGEAGQGDEKSQTPLPTLDQARALTPKSDFQPFMQPGVAQNVRNAAVKQLFTDPHFNVMDGLDIYIGDYNTPDPLPAGMLQKMVGAQLLGLFDQAAQAPVQTAAPAEPTRHDGSASASPVADLSENPEQSPAAPEDSSVVAQSPPPLPDLAGSVSPMLPPLVNAQPKHDHPDLQLQPNHAPASPSSGPSIG